MFLCGKESTATHKKSTGKNNNTENKIIIQAMGYDINLIHHYIRGLSISILKIHVKTFIQAITKLD